MTEDELSVFKKLQENPRFTKIFSYYFQARIMLSALREMRENKTVFVGGADGKYRLSLDGRSAAHLVAIGLYMNMEMNGTMTFDELDEFIAAAERQLKRIEEPFL